MLLMMGSSAAASIPSDEDPKQNLLKQIRSHEVALGELNSLSSSRAVYQKNGSVFFQTTIKAAIASEQTQANLAKVQLQRLNS